MKPRHLLLLLLVAAGLALAALCLRQTRRLAQHRSQAAALRGQLEQTSQEVKALEASRERLIQQRRELFDQAQAQSARLNQAPATNAVVGVGLAIPTVAASPSEKPAGADAGFGKMLSKMMEDPGMKQVIRDQQRMIMDQLYAPLVKKLALTSEEASAFKDLLADNASKGAERATALLGGGTNRLEAMAGMTADHKNLEDQLKTLLGDARYSQYTDYQQTAAERMQLTVFKQQSGNDANLTDDQTEQLLSLMKEEKSNSAAAGSPLATLGRDAENLQNLLDEDKVQRLIETQSNLNQRVFERAGAVLSPDQLSSFARFQTNQLQMMRMGMTMARKFLAPDNSPPPAQP
jgi:hypothetical protein